jgi:hypothetical protein
MIININGWPGVGKLSVAERLRQRIGGRLLDNHAIFNVAFSLCDFHTPEFYQTVRAVREIAFERARQLPTGTCIILTSAYADTAFGRENWSAIRGLASARGTLLCNVIIDCSLAENIRRVQSAERAQLRKLTDPAPLIAAREASNLLDVGGDQLLRFDASHLTAEDSAVRIADWIDALGRR